MKSKIFKVVIAPVLGIALFAGAIFINANLNDPTVASASDDEKAFVQANQMTKGNMKLTVTEISFSSQPLQDDPKSKVGQISFSFENVNGKDKAFEPTGYIAALVGSSGKVYNLKMIESIDQTYQKTRKVAQKWAKDHNETYNPGEFKTGELIQFDADEENLTKVIYQDEKGNTTEIPIVGIKPEIKYPNPDAK